VTRSFQVPAGKPLLVPIINFFDTEPAEIDPPAASLMDRENAASIVVAGWLNATKSNLFASIDGSFVSQLGQHLEVSGLFSMGPVQAGSMVEAFGVPAGAELYPTKVAGYWLMIEGLAPGPHTLHFGGSSEGFTPDDNCCTTFPIAAFSTDITANIVVVPEPNAALLILPG